MEIVKTVVTTIDVLVMLLMVIMGVQSEGKEPKIGFGGIIAFVATNIIMIWS